MKKKLLFLIIIILASLCFTNIKIAMADEFDDTISEQLESIDLSEIEEYVNNSSFDFDVAGEIKKMLNGEYKNGIIDVLNFFLSGSINSIKKLVPTFLSVISIALMLVFINAIKAKSLSSQVSEIVFLIVFYAVFVLLFSKTISLFINCKNTIISLAKFNEIMSPIMITLLVISGSNVTAGACSPVVTMLSTGINGIIINFLLSLIVIILVLDVISSISTQVKFKGYSNFLSSLVKWVLGIIIFLFGTFITFQGVVTASHDGISFKATKYILTNSVPIVGGIIKDGFDLVAYSSVLIKNSIGLCGVFILTFTVLPCFIELIAFNFMLKLSAGIIESVSDERMSNILLNVSKFINYLVAFLIITFILIALLIILMITASNSIF